MTTAAPEEQHESPLRQSAEPPATFENLLRSAVPPWLLVTATLLLAAVLYRVGQQNYLLFHSLVEIFYVAVAFTIFSIGWNARKFIEHNTLMLLATAFAVIGGIELLHFLTYKGMGVFPGIDANISTQLWVVGRYLEAGTFLAAGFVLGYRRPISDWTLLGVSVLVGLGAALSIWPIGIFPDCYIEGTGLTTFKIVSEYVASALLLLAIVLFRSKRVHIEARLLNLLTAAIVFSIVAELFFTLYDDVYGLTNFLGHFAKFLSVVFLYRVLVIGTLRSPYALLFRDLNKVKDDLALELEQRRKTEDELRNANRELDAFVRTVSHDLRSPLTPIIGLPELILENMGDRLDSYSKKSLKDIREQGLRMSRLLEDLLTFARAGRLLDSVRQDSLENVVSSVLEDLGSRIIARQAKVEVHDLPEATFPRTALTQIFSNLVGNAIKYAGRAGSPIEIGGWKEDDSVLIYVRDHGPGVPSELREKIFDVFYRGENHTEEPGSGVGLATVAKLVTYLSGKIWVEETAGGGATFYVRLKTGEPELQQKLNFNIP